MQQDEHPALSADDFKLIKRAIKCPKSLIKSDIERAFLQETADRLGKFSERIYLSEKQIAWLRKIAGRMDGGRSSKQTTEQPISLADDSPEYGEMVEE